MRFRFSSLIFFLFFPDSDGNQELRILLLYHFLLCNISRVGTFWITFYSNLQNTSDEYLQIIVMSQYLKTTNLKNNFLIVD